MVEACNKPEQTRSSNSESQGVKFSRGAVSSSTPSAVPVAEPSCSCTPRRRTLSQFLSVVSSSRVRSSSHHRFGERSQWLAQLKFVIEMSSDAQGSWIFLPDSS